MTIINNNNKYIVTNRNNTLIQIFASLAEAKNYINKYKLIRI